MPKAFIINKENAELRVDYLLASKEIQLGVGTPDGFGDIVLSKAEADALAKELTLWVRSKW